MSNNQIGVFNMTLPSEGPMTIPLNFDMGAATDYEIDLTQIVETGVVSFITGAWIDNSLNGQILNIKCAGNGQEIKFPANKQGFMQLMLTNPPKLTLSQAAIGDNVKLIFVNFPVFPIIF